MNKTVLAVAMSAALVSGGVSAAEVYSGELGSVEVGGHLRTQLMKEGKDDVKLNAGSSRVSIGANYNMTETLDVLAYVEFGLSGNGGELQNRLHYTGIAGDFGSLKFGRQWTVADDFGSADVSYFYGGTGNTSTLTTGARHDSLVKYEGGNDTFTYAASYGFSANSGDDDQQEIAEAYVNGDFGSFTLGATVGTAKDANAVVERDAADKIVATYSGKATYGTLLATVGFGDFTLLGGLSAQSVNVEQVDVDVTGYQVSTQYKWADNATAYLGYEKARYEGSNTTQNAKVSGSTLYVGTDYHFNKFSRIYAEVARVDGSSITANKASRNDYVRSDEDAETKFGVGFRVYW
ncbi:porin [Thaumasiovibrio subtropicus]|uniref:porin n=1 Tax=Thaumasiovibrio subtropicus TaxID=1891207 RepID=UPI00131E050D|nr:porin [Thaumasiovibrio subtropicus]